MRTVQILISLFIISQTAFAFSSASSNSVKDQDALIEAVQKGDDKKADALLKKGVSLNSTGSGDQSALMALADQGETESIDELIGKGADINFKNQDNETALSTAITAGHEKLALHLIKKGAAIDGISKFTGDCLLHSAVKSGMTTLVKDLKNKQKNCLSLKNKKGQTPADIAKTQDMTEIEKILKAKN